MILMNGVHHMIFTDFLANHIQYIVYTILHYILLYYIHQWPFGANHAHKFLSIRYDFSERVPWKWAFLQNFFDKLNNLFSSILCLLWLYQSSMCCQLTKHIYLPFIKSVHLHTYGFSRVLPGSKSVAFYNIAIFVSKWLVSNLTSLAQKKNVNIFFIGVKLNWWAKIRGNHHVFRGFFITFCKIGARDR